VQRLAADHRYRPLRALLDPRAAID
jgi:hypothetical protein